MQLRKIKKLAIITSHPIQYNAPIFKMFADRNVVDVKVFYTWGDTVLENKYDPGFKKNIAWDIPLLNGYAYEFLENIATAKGSHHFKGIINPSIIDRIDEYCPDAILVYGWAFDSHLKVLKHYYKKKLILFRGDSTLLDKQSYLKQFVRTIFLTYIYRHVNYALFVGKHNFDYFKKVGLKEKQLLYAPHAIDNNRFAENEILNRAEAEKLKLHLNIAADKIVFLFAGKLEDKKDPATLLQAFVEAGIEGKANLIIVGNGKLEIQLKNDFGHHSFISFIDFQNQSQMPVIYCLADVFVLPSKGPGETWGLAINEAMACSLPIIASDTCGGAIDLIDSGQNGFIFKAASVYELKGFIKNMTAAGKERLKEMGKYSRLKIADFSFENFCAATEDILVTGKI